jgi:murein DD-endopeptidase MepM/ murein hydrolase activator NlpD
MGEHAGRAAVRFVKRRIRTRPARHVREWEQKDAKARADLRFRQMAREKPELESNALNRYLQKRRWRKQYEKQAKDAAKKTGETAVSATEKAGRAAAHFVRKHPAAVLIILLCFLLTSTLHSCISGALTLGNGLAGAIGGASYLAQDEDIDEAELHYREWETDLTLQALNAKTAHPGYDEYRYSIDAAGHYPFAMLAYLTAKHDNFKFAAVQGELLGIFNSQYSLAFTRIVEVRSYTVRWTDAEGNSHSERVYYNYYILQTTLTARPFEEVISPMLTTQNERDRYAVYMLTHGNRQYVGSPLPFNWLPYVSSYYGYRVHPISGEKDYHTGADIALPEGTEILAGGTGVVLESGANGSYGLTLLVDYGKGVTARYAHCSKLFASAGQTVRMGEVIALSGNTGNSTGPHLHLEVMKNGRYLNPLYFVCGTN